MSPRKIAEQTKNFTATGDGTVIDMSTGPMALFSLQVVKTGTVTAWTIELRGSLDGTNYDTVLATHTESAPGDKKILAMTAPVPVKKAMLKCTVLTTTGGSVTATVLGVPA